MKAYLIDSNQETVTEVNHNGDYKEIYKLCGFQTFDVARVESNGDAIYVDDEGLLNITNETKFFVYEGYTNPLVGNGLMLGLNPHTGDSIAPETSLEDVKSKVKFLTLEQVRYKFQML